MDRGVPRGQCKTCVRAKRMEYYKTHIEQATLAGLVYRQSVRGQEKRRAWGNARAKTSAAKAYQQAWAQTEKGKVARRRRVQKYAKTPKGRAAYQRKKAARRAAYAVESTLTAEEWNAILQQDGYACHYCLTPYTTKAPATQDHVIPISKNGHHTKDNIVSACRSCNTSKHNKDEAEWKKLKSLSKLP